MSSELEKLVSGQLQRKQPVTLAVGWREVLVLEPNTFCVLFSIALEDLCGRRCSLDRVLLQWEAENNSEHSLELACAKGYLVVACVSWFVANAKNEV